MSISQGGSVSAFPAGWGWPALAHKAHYFKEGEVVSLCRKWMHAPAEREPETGKRTKDDCVICVKKLESL